MRKLTFVEWVEVAELVAAVGVIASLLLVVYSLERNSDLRLTEERWQQLVDGFDPGFWAHAKEAVFGVRSGTGQAGGSDRG